MVTSQKKGGQFDVMRPIKESAKFIKDLFYYKEYETKNDALRAFKLPPSIQSHMHFKEYDAKHELFLMDDGRNYGAVFEIRGFPTEGRDKKTIESYADHIANIVSVIERFELKDSPYIVQCYVNDEPHLYNWYDRLKEYGNNRVKGDKINRVFLAMAKDHMRHMCKEGGAFRDKLTGNDFKGGERITRMVIYRSSKDKECDPLADMIALRQKLEEYLSDALSRGLTFKRCNDKDYYHWLFNVFHQQVEGYEDIINYLEDNPYIERVEERPFGYHFTDRAFGGFVESDLKNATWKIGSTYHKYVSTTGLQRAPDAGHFTAELSADKDSKSFKALFDSMPEGSMLHVTFVCQSEVEVTRTIESKEKTAGKSTSKDAEKMAEEADYWLGEIASGNYLFPAQVGCYVKGCSQTQVDERYTAAKAKLDVKGFEVINNKKHDIYALDKFLRFLPGNYDHRFDAHFYSSRWMTAKHIANILPIGYSRSKGTGNPMLSRFSRNAEVVGVDPIVDISSSPHLLMLGTTGSGKSVSAAEMLLSVMALHKPYLTMMDAGKSNELLVDFFERMGLSVRRYVIAKPKGRKLPDFSLSPYLQTKELVSQVKAMEEIQSLYEILDNEQEAIESEIKKQGQEQEKKNIDQVFSPDEEEDAIERDYVAEFQLATLLMCCEGREPEEAGITEDHRAEILPCIIGCAKEVIAKGKDQMIASDLVSYMQRQIDIFEKSGTAHEMDSASKLRLVVKRLKNFLSNPLNNLYFNRPAKREVTPDVTYFELGLWKNDNEANLAPRSLAFVVMMNRTMAEAEARQNNREDDRFSLFFGDECHVVTTKKVTAASLTQCSKMSRKVGLILWLATQNVKDFNDIAAKMLSMFGFWICLEMSKSEFEKAMSFVDVTDLERNMFNTIHNEKGLYSEAALMSKNFRMVMRCYPFRELLFLAFNDPKEKTARAKVAHEYNLPPVEAALLQAQFAKGFDEETALARVKGLLAA